MTNFIFKSTGTYKKLANTLEVLLSEQKHQRCDLSEIKYMLHKLLTNKDLQTTVDKFYENKDSHAIRAEDSSPLLQDPDYLADRD